MQSSLSLFVFEIHRSSTDDVYQLASSNIEPTNGITSFPVLAHPKRDLLFPVVGNKGSPTYDEDCRRRTTPADPRVASCIRFDHRQAIHLLSTSLKHVSQGQHEAFKGKNTPRADPLRVGFPRGETHRLDGRRPGRPSKRPTGEASEPGSLKAPFQPPTQSKQTHPFFLSEQVTASPWVKPISWQRPRQRDIDPQARPGQSSRQSDSQCFPGSNPFRGKGPVKETSILKPVQVSTRITKLQRERGSTRVGEHKTRASLSMPFPLRLQHSSSLIEEKRGYFLNPT